MSQPDIHALAVLALTVVALILFTRDRIPLEATSLFILIALGLGFELFPYFVNGRALEPSEFFLGFGHEALVTICALMVIGRSLETTGALEPVARIMAKTWKTHPSSSLLATLGFTGVLSAFMNNTPIVVMLLPVLVSVALRTGGSASGSSAAAPRPSGPQPTCWWLPSLQILVSGVSKCSISRFPWSLPVA